MNNATHIGPRGSFAIGCNYWASHAGVHMWSDWRPDVIESDFQRLKDIGIQTIRCFLLWPIFQPISLLRGIRGVPFEYGFGERPISHDEFGQAGVSREAMDHFSIFANLAKKYDLELIVGLITGWMSGRLFVPPALEGLNVHTDPVSLMWQVRLARCFVRHFRNQPNIVGWDLGNECNCSGVVKSREEAWMWTSTISNAIRSEDSTRPIISGMHSLRSDEKEFWTIEDQGELTDVLTIHPYPIFTPLCDLDPINTIRSVLHSTAESVFYSSVGGKPCFTEEIGTLGEMMVSDKIAADYLRNVLFSLWSHGDLGLLWWCAFDQYHLQKAPYAWYQIENSLGLYYCDGVTMRVKPVGESIHEFSTFLETAPKLPPRRCDAVCILPDEQRSWETAYNAFILAKQAGFDIEFQSQHQPLRDARLYLLPSAIGPRGPQRVFFEALMRRVKEGATLYISIGGNILLANINEYFGIEVQTREYRHGDSSRGQSVTIKMGDDTFVLSGDYRLNVRANGAEVLATEPDGNPVFTRYAYGQGLVYFLQVPLENNLSQLAGAYHEKESAPYWKFYSEFSQETRKDRVVEKTLPLVGVTEHPRDELYRYVSLINYAPSMVSFPLQLKAGWKIVERFYGECSIDGTVSIRKNDAVVLGLAK